MKTNNPEYQANVDRLKELIEIELDFCDGFLTPTVCANISDPVSKGNLINLILEMCLNGNISVDEAIQQYERTFNPNMIN